MVKIIIGDYDSLISGGLDKPCRGPNFKFTTRIQPPRPFMVPQAGPGFRARDTVPVTRPVTVTVTSHCDRYGLVSDSDSIMIGPQGRPRPDAPASVKSCRQNQGVMTGNGVTAPSRIIIPRHAESLPMFSALIRVRQPAPSRWQRRAARAPVVTVTGVQIHMRNTIFSFI